MRHLEGLILCSVAMLAGSIVGRADESSVPVAIDVSALPTLIGQLGDPDYGVREAAQSAIQSYGFEAFDALTEAEAGSDPEIAARARYLVKRMQVEWTTQQDSAEVRRLMSAYASRDDGGRRSTIELLATLPDGQGLSALARLARFESALLRAKQSGIRAVESISDQGPVTADIAASVTRTLGKSNRPAVEWIRTALARQDDPSGAIERWRGHLLEEEETLRTFPQRSHVELLRGMIRVQADWLSTAERREEAETAMRRLVALDAGSSTTLQELVRWLADRGAWSVIDELERRFRDRIERDALLLYRLAQARARQGDTARSEALAAQALAMDPVDPMPHLKVALYLSMQGMRRFAVPEYRKVIEEAAADSDQTLIAQIRLAEVYYDQGDNASAAATLRAGLDALAKTPQRNRIAETLDRDPPSMRARMLFFEAMEAEKTDQELVRARLFEALAADSTDLDVLIHLHRRADLADEERRRVRQLVLAAAAEQRVVIQSSTHDATAYNQLAWLLGNAGTTEEEHKEALSCSKRSLELRPNEPGFLDTLAHCYAGLGDFENAVKCQERAVEGDPESGLLRAALERFRARLAEQTQQSPTASAAD